MDLSENNIDLSDNGTDFLNWTAEHRRILYMVCKKTDMSENQAYNELIFHNGDYKKIIEKYQIRSMIDIVVNQTDYTSEESYNKLVKHNGDIIAIIKEYMGAHTPTKEQNKSVNQQIFSEIRGFMDTAMRGYNKRKEGEDFFKNK